MDGTDPGAGQHGHGQLRDHREVDGHPIAPADAEPAEHVGEPRHVGQQLLVGDGPGVPRLALPVERHLVTPPGGHVAVEAVVRHVEGAAVEPTGEGQVPFEHRVPGPEPVQGAGLLGPEPLPVGGPLVDGRIRHHRPAPELLGGGEHPILGEVVLDSGPGGGRGSSGRSIRWLVRHVSILHHEWRNRLHPHLPQPNAGGTLRWKGREYNRTVVRGERCWRPSPRRSAAPLRPRGRGHPGRGRPRPARHGGIRPPAHPGGHPVDDRGLGRAGPGPRHLGRPGPPHHRRQPLRPDRRDVAGRGRPPFDRGPPAAASGLHPVPRRRGTAGHPPDRHPRAGLRHRSAGHGGHGRPGGRATRAGRPPPAHRHRGPGRPGGAGRARLRLGVQRPGDGIQPGGRRQARGHRAHPGRTGLAVAGRHVRRGCAVARRARPAERPLGAVPVRGVPHALPAPGPLRLVVGGPVRGGLPAPGGGDPLGARPSRVGVAGPGHPPRPHRRLRGPDRGGADHRTGGAGRADRRPRAVEPPDVVDPRRWRPGRGAVGGLGQRRLAATPGAGWWAGATPA